jgi:hypothetical protein
MVTSAPDPLGTELGTVKGMRRKAFGLTTLTWVTGDRAISVPAGFLRTNANSYVPGVVGARTVTVRFNASSGKSGRVGVPTELFNVAVALQTIEPPEEGGAKKSVSSPVQAVVPMLAKETDTVNSEPVTTVAGGGVWLTKFAASVRGLRGCPH